MDLTTSEKELITEVMAKYGMFILQLRCNSINGEEIQELQQEYNEISTILKKLQ